MANTKTVTVEDFGSYQVAAGLTVEEARRSLSNMLQAPWLTSAVVCTKPNGDFEFKRPPAAPKG